MVQDWRTRKYSINIVKEIMAVALQWIIKVVVVVVVQLRWVQTDTGHGGGNGGRDSSVQFLDRL